jgi:hypothetical protein
MDLPNGLDYDTVTLDDAVPLIDAPPKRQQWPSRVLGDDPATGAEMLVKEGRNGRYVTDGAFSATMPEAQTFNDVTLGEGIELIEKRAVDELARYPEFVAYHTPPLGSLRDDEIVSHLLISCIDLLRQDHRFLKPWADEVINPSVDLRAAQTRLGSIFVAGSTYFDAVVEQLVAGQVPETDYSRARVALWRQASRQVGMTLRSMRRSDRPDSLVYALADQAIRRTHRTELAHAVAGTSEDLLELSCPGKGRLGFQEINAASNLVRLLKVPGMVKRPSDTS